MIKNNNNIDYIDTAELRKGANVYCVMKSHEFTYASIINGESFSGEPLNLFIVGVFGSILQVRLK